MVAYAEELGAAMKRLGSRAVVSAALLLGCAGAAFAADYPLVTKEYPVAAGAPKSSDPTACNSFQAFVVTDCQLIWAGVRFYGTIDVGGTYQTHGAPFDPYFVTGASYFMQKMNRTAGWSIGPNGMGQSALGIQVKEPLGLGWSLIGQLEGGFDPYSLEYANSPHSEFNNIGIPQHLWTTNGDSSRGGQFYNSLGFVGVSNDTYGTLTVLRQNALTLDGVLAYDPMGGAYAFSPIGFSGVVAGGGYTENAKYTTALKYRLNIANWRVAGLWQFGGYDQNNASEGAFEAQIGGDFKIGPGTLSLDAIWGFNKDGVALGLGGAPNNLQGIPNLFGPGSNAAIMTATISNNTNVMALAKYTWDKWRLFAGYEWNQFANPSDPFVGKGSGFTDIAGDFVCVACNNGITGTNINSTAFNASAGFKDRVLQVFWTGFRYDVTTTLYVAGAYYHYDQNDFAASTANQAFCNLSNANKNWCSGTMDAASALVDWKFLPKWDWYLGTFYSQFNGGLVNGYLVRSNIAATSGVRFRF
jgi:predicted porin